jgi:hypothetical protein
MFETRAGEVAEATVHVRYEGRSFDVRFRDLDLGPDASARVVREALARYLELPLGDLNGYVIERHETGNWTVRPEAVFG